MMEHRNIFISYEIFSEVFSYPNDSLRKKIKDIQENLNTNYPEATQLFQQFTKFSESVDLKTWEEIYTRSFDVQALTTLDLGYVLFGDDYKRGELLVNLSNEHKKVNNPCGNELADHLPNVLKLLGKLNDEDLRSDIITFILIPALTKIASEFDAKHIEKKSNVYKKHHRTMIHQNELYGTIYQKPIQALLKMIDKDFSNEIVNFLSDQNFSHQISNELEIEKLR
jgi:nitrate reductase molybdenum cofactor assembly chaperone